MTASTTLRSVSRWSGLQLAPSNNVDSGLFALKLTRRGIRSTACLATRGSRTLMLVTADATEAFSEDISAPSVSDASDKKLYVGNLPFNMGSADLAEIFQGVAEPELVEVIYDKQTGRSRGFGFVTMRTREGAETAIRELDGKDSSGRTLKVNFPTPPAARTPRSNFGSNGSNRPSYGSREGGGFSSARPRRVESPYKLYVGNLAWGTDSEGLKGLFEEFGGVEEARVITDRDTGRSRGFGFVSMADGDAMNRAIEELDGVEVDGRPIRVTKAAEKTQGGF